MGLVLSIIMGYALQIKKIFFFFLAGTDLMKVIKFVDRVVHSILMSMDSVMMAPLSFLILGIYVFPLSKLG